MAKITYISHSGDKNTVDVPNGDSVMEGAVQNGIDGSMYMGSKLGSAPLFVAECGGNCQCATCHVYVLEGADKLKPRSDDENAMLEATASERKANSRLSCQLIVSEALEGLVVETPETQT